jgi:hypothetical protein
MNKKTMIIGCVAAVVMIGVAIAIIVVNVNKEPNYGGNGETGAAKDKELDEEKIESATVTPDDLKKIDETIEFGDFDAQHTLSKAIQNGEKLDKVVKIDGTVSHFGKGMSYNIGQRKEEGNQFIGTTFTIEDGAEEDYPADGDHVVITGIVRADDSGLVYTIKTLKAYVEKK